MNDTHQREGLAALAALIAPGSGDGTVGPVTIDELDLARALRGDSLTAAEAANIAALLRLADNSPLAGVLRQSLCEMFIDESPADHAAAFGVIYWQYGIPGLGDEAKEQAAQLLFALRFPDQPT